ncbi:MAG: DEAD/DEAH box helicase, partial [Bdellovibrionota bacterium]
PTGAGKTYAAFIGALLATQKNNDTSTSGVRILYVTPLRAVTRDIRISLERALMALRPEWRAEDRTGDTTFSAKARQRKNSPEVLVTTPESLSVLLTYDDHAAFFASLDTIIVDEWHEILGNKRGSLLELTLARIRKIKPEVKTWALSATIGNPDEAARVVTGNSARVITGKIERTVNIESLMPERIDTFPWAGSLGLRMAKDLIARLDPEKPTLIFTNTRTQAERWHQTIAQEKPDWIDHLALHHGSLDRDERERVESGLKTGDLSIVVCTSSLDLGVDFAPIEMVVQIGSPKAVARLVQRAGRSAHRPGEQANILFVPTHALELIEISAVRQAIESGLIETKKPVERPLDVMVQHMVTRALGGGFSRHEIFEEIRTAHSFRTVTGADLDWALRFITQGGDSLQAYPAYRKVDLDEDGRYRVLNSVIARTHRMSIGTIDSNATIRLKFQRGKDIGQVEESFIARLKPGDRFLFAGKVLQLIRLNEMEATVKLATGTSTTLPTWAGGRLPFSSPMSAAVRHTLADVANGRRVSVEMDALKPIVMAQEHYSSLPNEEETLIEITQSREGHHAFIYPFEGRLVHEVLGALVAY